MTKIEAARKLYADVNGNEDAFMARVGTEIPLLTRNGALTYYRNIHYEALRKQGILNDRPAVLIGRSNGNQPIPYTPKRTILVMLEMELTEEEDTYQTAELAVDLLNQNLSNDVKLVAASEKANG